MTNYDDSDGDKAEGGGDGNTEGWVKKRLNKIKSTSTELGREKSGKGKRSRAEGCREGYEALYGAEEDGEDRQGLLGSGNGAARIGSGNGISQIPGSAKEHGVRVGGNGKSHSKEKQQWASAGKLLKAFRAELNPKIG